MAKRKRLSFASALAISNKGKAKFVKLGKVQKLPSFKIPKFPTGKLYKKRG